MMVNPAANKTSLRKNLLALLTLGLGAVLAFAQPPKIAKDLQHRLNDDAVDVIVQFNRPLNANLHDKVLKRGGVLKQELHLVNAASYSLPASALAALARQPEIAYVSPDRRLRSTGRQGVRWANDYHTDSINAAAAWALGLDGTGIGIAVIDSGIADLPDLNKNNVVLNLNIANGGKVSAADQYGGSHVAGIIAGTGKKLERLPLHLHLPGHRSERESDQPARAR